MRSFRQKWLERGDRQAGRLAELCEVRFFDWLRNGKKARPDPE
jgi:hypothetical protein